MATLQELIDGLKTQVEGFVTSLADKLTELNTARDAALDAAAQADAKVDEFYDLTAFRNIYVHKINGDDANTGKQNTAPVKTFERALELSGRGEYAMVRMMTDLDGDFRHFLRTSPGKIFFSGAGDDGTGYVRRKLRFVDVPTLNNRPGGFTLYSNSTFELTEVDVEMAYNATYSPVTSDDIRLDVFLNNSTITRTGTGSPLFGGTWCGHFKVSNVVIDASASGHIITGVASGGDPNALDGITANFTQS